MFVSGEQVRLSSLLFNLACTCREQPIQALENFCFHLIGVGWLFLVNVTGTPSITFCCSFRTNICLVPSSVPNMHILER